MKRTIVTFLVVAIATALVITIISGRGGPKGDGQPSSGASAQSEVNSTAAAQSAAADHAVGSGSEAGTSTPAALPVAAPKSAAPAMPATTLKAFAPTATDTASLPIGTLTTADAQFEIGFSANAAGIERIRFAHLWNSAKDARADALAMNGDGTVPPDSDRYALTTIGTLAGIPVPMLAMHSIVIDGAMVDAFGSVWSSPSPGVFVTEVRTAEGAAVVRVTRTFVLGEGAYDLSLLHRIDSLDGATHAVQLIHYGPGDLTLDVGGLMDIRRFMIGALFSEKRDPAQSTVLSNDTSLDRKSVISQLNDGNLRLWPTDASTADGRTLSWIGTTNRYFALALHADRVNEKGSVVCAIGPAVESIDGQVGDATNGEPTVFTVVRTMTVSVAPGAPAQMQCGVYAGPLERSLLRDAQPMASLNMIGMIVYEMGGCCTMCTFAWLANGLVILLGALHDYIVFDWALAIIVLTIIVRLALHPLTRSSQISMARFSKQMSSMKPELEALQKRFADDKPRMQQEQMRLYREKGMNPGGCIGGMLPMFLQMPIWMALYAVLYVAFELRQEPAFFGIFQLAEGWGFLGDLSAPDRFIPLPVKWNLYILTFESINLVPLLMGVVFWLQQKYSAPPSSALTPEQEQQQAMMKIMMPIMFPIMLYNAPSGLTLYIATSTLIGFLESKRIRAEIETMDLLKPRKAGTSRWQGAFGRAIAAAQAKADTKRRAQPPRR